MAIAQRIMYIERKEKRSGAGSTSVKSFRCRVLPFFAVQDDEVGAGFEPNPDVPNDRDLPVINIEDAKVNDFVIVDDVSKLYASMSYVHNFEGWGLPKPEASAATAGVSVGG